MNDVILSKVTTIERCVKRIHEVYKDNPENLLDFTKQDSIILNIQRACEASIDIAMHIVSEKKIGVPKASREAFKLLQESGIIDAALAKTLMNMVGFRNIAVHDYQVLELDILKAILNKHIDDFKKFTKTILKMDH
ncbi:type VII toxin-antitoxin system HepT family RNase toxin [Bacillus sp. DJP31]|uniref:type VII toxin-antitoxin system HepT family RNase toxin n=1 Tax=Bacillus sp. DJP31 TaxID=3409789 RepID=UPI003BB74167